jgi:hypothetical protein
VIQEAKAKLLHAIFGRSDMPSRGEIEMVIDHDTRLIVETQKGALRQALRMRFLEGASGREIEDATGLAPRFVRRYEVRVLRRLGR